LVQVIAEPGRFLGAKQKFCRMACKVIARRKGIGKFGSKDLDMLYINDGLYGSFMNASTEKASFVPKRCRVYWSG